MDDTRLNTPLDQLRLPARVLSTCERVGLTTVGDVSQRGREELLALRGCGPRTADALLEAVATFLAEPEPRVDLQGLAAVLPQTLLQLSLGRLGLPTETAEPFAREGLDTVGHVLERHARDEFPADADLAAFRDALTQVLDMGIASPATSAFAATLANLLSALTLPTQELVRAHLGLTGRPVPLRSLAARRRISPRDVTQALANARRRLRQHATTILDRLCDEGARLLDRYEGVATPGGTIPGTLLHDGAKESGDSMLPFRLLCFCDPDRFFTLGKSLTRTPPHRVRAIRKAIRQMTRPVHLPIDAEDLTARLAERGLVVEPGLLLHLILSMGLTAEPDPDSDSVVIGRSNAVADRVHEILSESSGPMSIEDLVFHYRDRHRSCHKGRLLSYVRGDSRLLEIGPGTWSLRSRHERDLWGVADQVRQITARIHELGGRHSARELAEEEISERTAYLIKSCLRRDRSLRDLGRGEFCSARQPMSGLMREIHGALQRAMGELPIIQFLENQPESRRRTVAVLLRENRLFVEPAENRVDLLTNYPFTPERLHELNTLIDSQLAARDGYASLATLLTEVQTTPLGGEFLTEHLLGDLLRRHGPFEVLQGGIVAQRSIGLAGWIQHQAREVLRQADLPLTPDEILSSEPRLAEFAASLEVLLEDDPLVYSTGATHYHVV